MTEAMPFLQKAILLSYAPRPFPGEAFLAPQSLPLPRPAREGEAAFSKKMTEGIVSAHAGCTVFTEILGEFVTFQWADRVVGPYNAHSHSL